MTDQHHDGNPSSPSVHEEQDDYQAASQSTADYSQFIPPVGKQAKRHGNMVMVTTLVLVLLAAGGFGGYWFFLRPAKKTPTTTPTITQTSPTVKITAATKHYDSIGFGLGFDYPADWVVTEAAGSNQITVHSPVLTLTDATGVQTPGEVVLTVDQKGNNLTMFDKGNALAILASNKITYAKPSSTQRAQTYLSYLQYPTTTATNALDGVYITGDSGYQQGQAIPKVDVAKADPLIRVTFLKCANTTCAGTSTSLSLVATAWNDTTFSGPIQTMLESLVVQ